MTYQVDLIKGETLLEAIRREKIILEAPCNGKGYCGKCKVKIHSGNVSSNDELAPTEGTKNIYLACYTKGEGKVVFSFPGEEAITVLTKGHLPSFELNPNIKKAYDPDENITTVFYGNEIIGKESGDTEKCLYGLSVDIGTTTVVASLIDLREGKEIANASLLNPQKEFGLDVLSRINYVNDSDHGLKQLQKAIIDCLNNLISRLEIKTGISKAYCYEMVIAANTIMLHLLLGVDPTPIGKAPYEPVFIAAKEMLAEEMNIKIAPSGKLYTLPSVSGYVGADIVAGILVAELQKTDEKILFIDIGTNGEIVFSDGGKMVSCSCAAGPALEGMNISCGMRGAVGAIEKITIGDDGVVSCQVIGESKAKGICGSGVLSIIAQLNKAGYIHKTGRLKKPSELSFEHQKNIVEKDGKRAFLVCDNGLDTPIYFSQNDIRQVQLAKGAILSGFVTLLEEKNIEMTDLDKVVIAGQFGFHLPVESLVGSGLLPSGIEDKVFYIGNASKNGAILCLLSKEKRQLLNSISQQVEYIELSFLEGYEDRYIKCLSF